MDISPIKIIFLAAGGLMILFLLLKYTINLDVYVTRFFSLGITIKILISFLFIMTSFLAYKQYDKS